YIPQMDAVISPVLSWFVAHGECVAVRGKGDAVSPRLRAHRAQGLAGASVPQANTIAATCRGQCLTVRGKGEANDVLFVPLPKCPARDHVPQLESIVELGDDRLAIVRKREIQRSLVSPLTVPILEFAQQFPRRCFQEIETAYLSTTGSQDTPI